MNEARIIDLAPTASLIIRQLVELKKEEELLLIVDTESIMPMAYALAFVAYEQGNEYSIAMMPSREKGFGRNADKISVLPKAIDMAFTGADVIIGLTRGSFAPSLAPIQIELIFEKKKARYLSMAFRDLECFTKGAGLCDYQQLKNDCLRLKGMMEKSRTITIQTALGTKLSAEIPVREDSPEFPGPYVRLETGWATMPGTEAAFPDGEVFFCPRQYSTNGVLVVDGPIEYVGVPEKPFKIMIEHGAITQVEGDSFEAIRLREILATMEDSSLICEVAVGMNPAALKNGNVQEEKKALGSVHIGFGVARRFKGTWTEKLENKIHSDIVLRNAVVSLDQTVVVKNHCLLI